MIKTYPNVAQSFGIVGIVVTGMLLFSPLIYVLNGIIGRELSLLIYYILAMGIPFWIVITIRKKKTKSNSFNFKIKNKRVIPFVIVVTIALLFGLISPISSLIPIPESVKETFMSFSTQTGVFAFVLMVIAAPLLEELIFRGIILEGLLDKYMPTKAILISSFLFGLVHLNPWQFITGFIIGVFSGWVYYKTKSLSLSIIIHASANFSGFLTRCFIDVETSMDDTLVQMYGGLINLIIAIISSILIIISCTYYLNKEFIKEEK